MRVYFLQQRGSRSAKWDTVEASLQRYELENLKTKRESYFHPSQKLRVVSVKVEVPTT